MLSRSRYSGDGHSWNSMSDMQMGGLCGGGFVFLEGGSQKGWFEPPDPPWLRACASSIASVTSVSRFTFGVILFLNTRCHTV